ncbi:MAG: hypothetical protein ACRDNS_23910, partial [Trebonia sp.]
AVAAQFVRSRVIGPLATVPVRQADKFYQRVCARLGEGTDRAPADDDPLIAWAQHHRSSSTSDREEARVGEWR